MTSGVGRTCPKCNLLNPPGAQRCDCGYDFSTGAVEPAYLTSSQERERQRWAFKQDLLRGYVAGVAVGLAFESITLYQILSARQLSGITTGLLVGTMVNVFAMYGPLVAAVYVTVTYAKSWYKRKRPRSPR
jgi:hypothetical protein